MRSEVTVAGIALQQALALQESANALYFWPLVSTTELPQ